MRMASVILCLFARRERSRDAWSFRSGAPALIGPVLGFAFGLGLGLGFALGCSRFGVRVRVRVRVMVSVSVSVRG